MAWMAALRPDMTMRQEAGSARSAYSAPDLPAA
jgi:hypothetical protein